MSFQTRKKIYNTLFSVIFIKIKQYIANNIPNFRGIFQASTLVAVGWSEETDDRQMTDRRHTGDKQTDRISELPSHRLFLDLSEMCLYMVHFGLGPFFEKKCIHRFIIKINQNYQDVI